MPITEAQMSYSDMKKIIKDPRYHCGERGCEGDIALVWGGSYGHNCHLLRCAKNLDHNLISKYNRKEEEYKQMVREQTGLDSKALVKMSETQMLARIEHGKFPQALTVPEKQVLAMACITYGFDPIMSELTIFQGKPYVQIDGRYRKAQETNELDGVETRPATSEERKAWDIPEGDYFFRAEVYRKGASHPFVGWGRVRKVETLTPQDKTPFRPIELNPQRMAEKRAEAQGLRKGFHIPLPSAEYIGTYEEELEVDTSTGEIIEGEATEIKPEAKPKAKAKVEPAESEGEELFPERTEKDKAPVTTDQQIHIKELMKEAGKDLAAIGKYCNDDKGWDIRKWPHDLVLWQYLELVKTFEKK